MTSSEAISLWAQDEPGAEAPPYILRSFADAFGYRLKPITPPASASADIGPKPSPR